MSVTTNTCSRLILSLSKDEASTAGAAASPFDRLGMRLNVSDFEIQLDKSSYSRMLA